MLGTIYIYIVVRYRQSQDSRSIYCLNFKLRARGPAKILLYNKNFFPPAHAQRPQKSTVTLAISLIYVEKRKLIARHENIQESKNDIRYTFFYKFSKVT
jgi:hypothetical protein